MTAPSHIKATNGSAWEQSNDDLVRIFQKLEPTLLAIRETKPDAFDDCIKMVSDVARAATAMEQNPSPTNARGLRRNWAPKARDIMKQAEATLYEHGASSGYISLCWSIEEKLQAMFNTAEDIIERAKPTPHIHEAVHPAAKLKGPATARIEAQDHSGVPKR